MLGEWEFYDASTGRSVGPYITEQVNKQLDSLPSSVAFSLADAEEENGIGHLTVIWPSEDDGLDVPILHYRAPNGTVHIAFGRLKNGMVV